MSVWFLKLIIFNRKKKKALNSAWWSISLVLREQKWEDQEFKTSLGHMRICLNQ